MKTVYIKAASYVASFLVSFLSAMVLVFSLVVLGGWAVTALIWLGLPSSLVLFVMNLVVFSGAVASGFVGAGWGNYAGRFVSEWMALWAARRQAAKHVGESTFERVTGFELPSYLRRQAD